MAALLKLFRAFPRPRQNPHGSPGPEAQVLRPPLPSAFTLLQPAPPGLCTCSSPRLHPHSLTVHRTPLAPHSLELAAAASSIHHSTMGPRAPPAGDTVVLRGQLTGHTELGGAGCCRQGKELKRGGLLTRGGTGRGQLPAPGLGLGPGLQESAGSTLLPNSTGCGSSARLIHGGKKCSFPGPTDQAQGVGEPPGDPPNGTSAGTCLPPGKTRAPVALRGVQESPQFTNGWDKAHQSLDS